MKRIMGRQGVIMALTSNPLNSLKTRERGGKRQRGLGCLQPCLVDGASRTAQGAEGGGEGGSAKACNPALPAVR